MSSESTLSPVLDSNSDTTRKRSIPKQTPNPRQTKRQKTSDHATTTAETLPSVLRPVFDKEDQLDRCPHCLFELQYGMEAPGETNCFHCGKEYLELDGDWLSTDAECGSECEECAGTETVVGARSDDEDDSDGSLGDFIDDTEYDEVDGENMTTAAVLEDDGMDGSTVCSQIIIDDGKYDNAVSQTTVAIAPSVVDSLQGDLVCFQESITHVERELIAGRNHISGLALDSDDEDDRTRIMDSAEAVPFHRIYDDECDIDDLQIKLESEY